MRIHSLELPEYKNLRNFRIDFDLDSPTTMLVGKNGTGKSNLIEALVTIFRDLDGGPEKMRATPFGYKIEYTIRGHQVTVQHNPLLPRQKTQLVVDGKPLAVNRFGGALLPETIFAYYSGPSNRLESIFESPLAAFRDAMIRRQTDSRQRMIYGRLIHSRFVLLSFLADGEIQDFPFLQRELGLEALESVLFVMKQPYWASRRQATSDKRDFWGAAGVVRTFLKELYAAAVAPLLLERKVAFGIRQSRTLQHLYLYLPDQQTLARLVARLAMDEALSRARGLFTILESAYVSDLIADVRVSLRKKNVDGTVTFTELSEGEQQLLMVLGLLRFTKDEESLFLLDEPDTHLNPAWSLRFLDLIEEAVGSRESSQLIMASHDPVAISLLRREQVRQLAVDAGSGQIAAFQPDEDPIKLGVSGVLLSELFGFQSVLAPEIIFLLEERDALRVRNVLTNDEQRRLAELDHDLSGIDLSSVHPDPLYGRFLKEVLAQERQELLTKPALTRAEVLEQRELTAELVREIQDGGARQ